jgi:hypothetical protein
MSFTLAKKTEAFYYPINLPVVTDTGANQVNKFEFRFKRLSRSKLNEMQKAQEAVADIEVDGLERDVDYIMEIADGWRGVNLEDGSAAPFNRETLHILLNETPNAAGEIVKAFFESTLGGGRKAKN